MVAVPPSGTTGGGVAAWLSLLTDVVVVVVGLVAVVANAFPYKNKIVFSDEEGEIVRYQPALLQASNVVSMPACLPSRRERTRFRYQTFRGRDLL